MAESGLTFASESRSVERTKKFPWKFDNDKPGNQNFEKKNLVWVSFKKVDQNLYFFHINRSYFCSFFFLIHKLKENNIL